MLALLPTDGSDPLVRTGEVAAPQPKDDEVLVAVDAFALNRGELFLLERPRPGWRPGKDVAGRVFRPAADGSGPALGERVVAHPTEGGWSELVPVRVANVAVIPPEIDALTAAALPLAGMTALRLLRAAGSLAGARVLLTGASGGVGHYVTELAAAAGAELTAVSAGTKRADRLAALGATAIVPDVADADGPFDVIFESVGGDSLAIALQRVRKGGRVIWFGQASRTPATLDFFSYFGQTGATLRHFHYEDSDVSVARDLATLVRLVRTGRLHPEVGVVAHWSQTSAVLTELRERQVRGKAVLCVPCPEHIEGATT